MRCVKLSAMVPAEISMSIAVPTNRPGLAGHRKYRNPIAPGRAKEYGKRNTKMPPFGIAVVCGGNHPRRVFSPARAIGSPSSEYICAVFTGISARLSWLAQGLLIGFGGECKLTNGLHWSHHWTSNRS